MCIDLLLIMQKSKKIILFDIDDTLFDTETFKKSNFISFSVYEDVHETLSQLAGIASLGIFSQGEIAFQKRKLEETNIAQYFLEEHMHIVTDKNTAIKELIKKYNNKGNIFLVEDRLPVIQMVKQQFPSVFTIWVKQGRYAPFQEQIVGFFPDAEVKKVRDVIPLIG